MGIQLNLEGRARWAVEGRDLGLSLGVLVRTQEPKVILAGEMCSD